MKPKRDQLYRTVNKSWRFVHLALADSQSQPSDPAWNFNSDESEKTFKPSSTQKKER